MNLARAAVLVATAVAAGVAHADVVTLNPVRDTSIYNGTPGSNALSDGSGSYLWLSVTAEGLNRRALLAFDVTGIAAGSHVREVRLSLYESRSRENHAVTVHRLLRDWGESTSNAGGSGAGAPAAPGDATWVSAFHPSAAWVAPGGDFMPTASASIIVGLENEIYTWGSTTALVADVQAWVDQPSSNHGWILIGNEQGERVAKRFESRNNSEPSLRPRLQVVYDPPVVAGDGDIPVPPWALGLLGLALSASLCRRTARAAAGKSDANRKVQ